jgi:hypothetical protein
MSLARCSKAYCQSQSTMLDDVLVVGVELALVLPSSTSCSKLETPLRHLALLLGLLDRRARL